MTDEQLLAEMEDLLRSMPAHGNLAAGDLATMPWMGRAASIFSFMDVGISLAFGMVQSDLLSGVQSRWMPAIPKLVSLIHQARHTLILKTEGPRSTAIAGGGVFHYFDEIRKIIEIAKSDIFFVDPYLDAEFVSKFLTSIPNSVNVRLLGKEQKYLATLLPAAKMLSQQNSIKISVRSTKTLHDRFVFVDGSSCYYSGASFKDGAKNAPVMISQVIDAFAQVLRTYDDLWNTASVEL